MPDRIEDLTAGVRAIEEMIAYARDRVDHFQEALVHLEEAKKHMLQRITSFKKKSISKLEETDAAAGKNRLIQAAAYLIHHGPATQKELHDETGIPMGSMAYVLGHPQVFRRLEDGRWDVHEEVRQNHLNRQSSEPSTA